MAYYLASSYLLKVGDVVDVLKIGIIEVIPNMVLNPNIFSFDISEVVLLLN
ncbi:MAG: hypothetical protein LBV77_01075 [Candidatus Adiutrix intracellularis]|jgi:hypothetical protein|nr:hypothetical protein [Candidatus Adiutrix intracellularis]